MSDLSWAYGVTTVPKRKNNALVKTLHSLCDAGFGDPQLFVDGCNDPGDYGIFECLVSCRPSPSLKIVGNWVLGLWELYIRNPSADRYALFQDDILAVGNLREYLNHHIFPDRGYLNLYTFKENARITRFKPGWHKSNQRGLGALGLVFNRDGLQVLLSSPIIVAKPTFPPDRNWKYIDGGILEAMKQEGWSEYIHNPSLLQHQCEPSSLGNNYLTPIDSFPGERFNAMELLKETSSCMEK